MLDTPSIKNNIIQLREYLVNSKLTLAGKLYEKLDQQVKDDPNLKKTLNIIKIKLLMELDRHKEALQFCKRISKDLNPKTDKLEILVFMSLYAGALLANGRYKEAEKQIDYTINIINKLSIHKKEEYEETYAELLGLKGLLAKGYGENEYAIKKFTESLSIQEKYPNNRNIANTYYNLGMTYNNQNENELALSNLSQANQIFNKIDYVEGIAFTLEALINLHSMTGNRTQETLNQSALDKITDKIELRSNIKNSTYKRLMGEISIETNPIEDDPLTSSQIEKADLKDLSTLKHRFEVFHEQYQNFETTVNLKIDELLKGNKNWDSSELKASSSKSVCKDHEKKIDTMQAEINKLNEELYTRTSKINSTSELITNLENQFDNKIIKLNEHIKQLSNLNNNLTVKNVKLELQIKTLSEGNPPISKIDSDIDFVSPGIPLSDISISEDTKLPSISPSDQLERIEETNSDVNGTLNTLDELSPKSDNNSSSSSVSDDPSNILNQIDELIGDLDSSDHIEKIDGSPTKAKMLSKQSLQDIIDENVLGKEIVNIIKTKKEIKMIILAMMLKTSPSDCVKVLEALEEINFIELIRKREFDMNPTIILN